MAWKGDLVDEKAILACLQQAFMGDEVELSGDGRHFYARIVSNRFLGLNRLARHRLVYAALGDHMREDIHALSIQAVCLQDNIKN